VEVTEADMIGGGNPMAGRQDVAEVAAAAVGG
jgi:hypothetical protein